MWSSKWTWCYKSMNCALCFHKTENIIIT